jgi:inner membrane protein
MCTVFTHFAVGAAIWRCAAGDAPRAAGPLVAGALAVLPDVDSLFMRSIAYGSPWGHRGMTHSLAFAAVVGLVAAVATSRRLAPTAATWFVAATLAIAVASHGFLDSLTDGGLGVAFFAPMDEKRWFFMVRPIPVAPITTNPFQSSVWRTLAVELYLVWPWALLLWTLRGPTSVALRIATGVGVAASVVAAWVRSR